MNIDIGYFIFWLFFTVIVVGMMFFCPILACYECRRAQKNYGQSQGEFI